MFKGYELSVKELHRPPMDISSRMPRFFDRLKAPENVDLKGLTEKMTEDIRERQRRELSVKEKQEIADQAAKDYNESRQPYKKALENGLEGVRETPNGGVSFEESDAVYRMEDGTRCVAEIKATGSRTKDFDAANKAMGLEETPEGYVWHHRDDYDVEKGTMTLELVKDEVHNSVVPHAGGCAQYDAVNGPSYNPPKKGVI